MPTEKTKIGNGKQIVELFVHLGQVLASTGNLDDFFDASVKLVVKVLDVEGCSIFLLDPVDNRLKLKASTRIPRRAWKQVQLAPGEGIVGKVIQTGRILWARTGDEVAALTHGAPKGQYKTQSFISVPVKLQGEPLGVVNVDSRCDGSSFSKDDTVMLKGLAGLFASALASSRLLEERARANRDFNSILQSINMGVAAFDPSFRLTHCNETAAELLGRPGGLECGREAAEVFPPKAYDRLVQMVAELCARGGGTMCGEIDLAASPKTAPIPLGLTLTELRANGAPSEGEAPRPRSRSHGFVLVIEDLRIRREVKELRHLADLKSHFLSLISHELRTPLTAIKGAVQLLMGSKTAGVQECEKRMLLIVERNCRRLASAVEDMLEVQSIESERTQLDLKPLVIEDVIRTNVESLRLLWEEKKVEVRLAFDAASATAAALDHDRINQVFKHLLDNAFKFCNPGGTVTVTIGGAPNVVEVRVTNTGTPIPVHYRGQIFGKFYQVETPMTRQKQGSGLGLYLARELTRLHKGDVTLERSDPEGTTFLVRLPTGTACPGASASAPALLEERNASA